MNIRNISESDSEAFLRLCLALDQETAFMMLEPGERTTTVEEQRQKIRSVLAQANQTILVVEQDDRLVGFLGAYGGNFQRNRHAAYIVIGILQAYGGQGIGKALFRALEAWADSHGLHRLELTVMCHNERAIRLYQNMGYKIEGIKQDSLWVNGRYADEYYMAKLLNDSPAGS
jgi:RimJ/RimL family protein N-acetyltransferase